MRPQFITDLLEAIRKDHEMLEAKWRENPPPPPQYQTRAESERIMEDWECRRFERRERP